MNESSCINSRDIYKIIIKIIVFILCIIVLQGVFCMSAKAEIVTVPASGTDNGLDWSIDRDGCLKVTGRGNYTTSNNGLPVFISKYSQFIESAEIDIEDITSTAHMFEYCSKLKSVNFSKFNTSKVTNMDSMFSGCNGLTTLDLSKLDTRNVINMGHMFEYCSSLTTLNLSNFDTSKVTNMEYMFLGCSSLTTLNLSDFDASNVKYVYGMFQGCSSLTNLDLNKLDTSNVTEMCSMFSDCSSLTAMDLSKLNTCNVTNMSYMFSDCSSLTAMDLSKLDTSKVTNMNYMFSGCSSLTAMDLSKLDTSSVTDMTNMFSECSKLTTINIGDIDTRNVTNMSDMFMDCISLTALDLGNIDTHKVQNMQDMLDGCSGLKSISVVTYGAVLYLPVVAEYCWKDKDGTVYTTAKSNGIVMTYTRQLNDTHVHKWMNDFTIDKEATCTEIGYKSVHCENCYETMYTTEIPATGHTWNEGLVTTEPTETKTGIKTYTCTACGETKTEEIPANNGNSHVHEWDGHYTIDVNPTCTEAGTKSIHCGSCEERKDITEIPATGHTWNKGTVTTPATATTTGIRTYTCTVCGEKYEKIIPVGEIEDNNIVHSGKSGDLDWSIDEDGLLLIQGTGDYERSPEWKQYSEEIKSAKVIVDGITSTNSMFSYCENLEKVDFEKFDTSKVEDMGYMFSKCTSLESINLELLDTSHVTTMGGMFNGCKALSSIDLSVIDTTNLTYIAAMFSDCISLTEIDLSHLDTSKVEYMTFMFDGCTSLEKINLNNVNTSNVKELNVMFRNCSSLKEIDVSGFDVSNVTGNNDMFTGCTSLRKITVPSGLIEVDAYGMKFPEIKDYVWIDENDVICTRPRKNLKTSMIYSCISNMEHVHDWNNGEITVEPTESTDGLMTYTCTECGKTYTDIIPSLEKTDAEIIFSGKDGDIDWSIDANGLLMLTGEGERKKTESGIVLGNSEWCKYSRYIKKAKVSVSKMVYAQNLFYGCTELVQVDFSNFDTSETKHFSSMFYECFSLEEVDLNGLDTKNVEQIVGMFDHCNSLKKVDLSHFDASSITDMRFLFNMCSALKEINMNGFVTTNARLMDDIFQGCSSLKEIDMSSFDMTNVTSVSGMFNGCYSLEKVVAPAGITSNNTSPAFPKKDNYVWLDEDGTECTYPKINLTVPMTYTCVSHVHEWDGDYTIDVNPTCTEIGAKSIHCRSCEETKDVTVMPATGHTWNSGAVTVAATQTTTGVKTYTCTVCGETKTEVIPATGTAPSNQSTNPPNTNSTNTQNDNVTLITQQPDSETTGQTVATAEATSSQVKNGSKITVSGAKYQVSSTKEKTVAWLAPTSSSVASITVPDTVTISGKKYKVTKIANNAFKNNRKLKKLKVGKNITEIGKNAFKGCTKLSKLTIGKNVKVIGDSAFEGCSALTSVIIEKNVTKIGKKAFYNCKSLKRINIKSEKLKSVGGSAFKKINNKYNIKVIKKYMEKYQKLMRGKLGA